ncbi:acetyl-CoA sensor PanZ family protein, partial [Pseudomonas aeruginosa]|uniref:acetyl-CoA sensor PanZ family protein n=1 Tax=Pseudomonas aeruginosa TaxID=287 RepID=UPI000E3231E9
MPVIVETLAQPSAQDRLDLAKIYADAPDWLFAPHADGAALVAAGRGDAPVLGDAAAVVA